MELTAANQAIYSEADACDLKNFFSPASFWTPDYLDNSAWFGHVPFAFWLTEVLNPRTFVELGTHYGYSYFTFCQAVQWLGLDTRCYAVDTWEGDEHSGIYGEEVFQKVSNYHERYSSFSLQKLNTPKCLSLTLISRKITTARSESLGSQVSKSFLTSS